MDRAPTTWSRLDRQSAPKGTERPQRAPRSASTECQTIQELELLLDAWPRLWPHQWSIRNVSCEPCRHRHEQQYHGRQREVSERIVLPSRSGRVGATMAPFVRWAHQPCAANAMVQPPARQPMQQIQPMQQQWVQQDIKQQMMPQQQMK